MGRRTKRILPEGQEETYAYNAWGEMESRTHFKGDTTTYTYDVMSRLLTESADAIASHEEPESFRSKLQTLPSDLLPTQRIQIYCIRKRTPFVSN